jgi:hypothetical protein
MDANSFGDLVRSKITERRQGRSEAMRAALECQRQANDRAAPLLEALRAMLDRLCRDPMFSRAFPGRPEAKIADQFRDGLAVTLDGAVGMMLVSLHEDGALKMSIHPHYRVKEALDCGHRYEPEPVRGTMQDLDVFLAAVEGQLAEFLADIYLSPAASMIMPAAGEPDRDEASGFR